MQPLSNANFEKGFNRFYDWNLTNSLRRIYKKHRGLFEAAASAGEKGWV